MAGQKIQTAAAPPGFLEFQRPKLVAKPPNGGGWIHEIKFDGYRLQAQVVDGSVTLFTRRGFDWTEKLAGVARQLSRAPDCVLDGELCFIGPDGQPSFSGLRAAIGRKDMSSLAYFPFDALWRAGEDVRPQPLSLRMEILEESIAAIIGDNVRSVAAFPSEGAALLESACRLGLEGIVSKRLAAPYTGGQSDTWVKAKCRLAQELVIGGWVQEPLRPFKSLLVGVYEPDGRLRYVGSLERGFARSPELLHVLARHQCAASPFSAGPHPRGARWVRPELVCEAEFQEWTAAGMIRHASFKGLRDDKPARDIQRERPSDEV